MFGERCEFDARDQAILDKRVALLNEARAKHGPCVGDFVLFPGEENPRRFTHDWGDSIQTTVRPKHPCYGDASFYLCEGGCSFSGSLDSSIPKSKLVDTGETWQGSAWFFHHGCPGAGRGVYFSAPFRVYRYEP